MKIPNIMKKGFILTLLFATMAIANGYSWGQKGHDTVCTIAQRHLTKEAKEQIADLLDGKSIVYWANWLDDASNTPEYAYTKTWHYKNIDAADTYESAPLLETGDVVRAIESQIEILKDKTLDRETRQLALKILVHVVGDIHQPMHMGHKTDLGGNRWPVNFFGRDTNLHATWDTPIVERAHAWTHTEWAEELDCLKDESVKAICQGGPNDWGKETYEIACKVYAGTPESAELSYEYLRVWTPVVEQQLLKGGLRLAWVLNDIFSPQMTKAEDASKNNITIGTIVYDLRDINARFKELHDAGFNSCEINYNSNLCNSDLAKQIRKASKKWNIRVTTVVGVPGESHWNFTKGPSTIGLVPAAGREAKIATYHDMINFCVEAGVPYMHSHFGFIPIDPSSDQYKDFIAVMKQLAEYAKERNIDILFETGQETPVTLIRAIKDIAMGNCFINCDLANLLLYGNANSLDAVKQFGSLIKEFHAKDGHYPNPENPYELGEEVPIPQGEVDFPGVIKELKRVGFTGALTIECELNESEFEYLVNTRKYLQSLIDQEN